MRRPAYTVGPEPFEAPDSQALRRRLAGELHERYGADSEPGAKPTAGDTAVWLVARRDGEAIGSGALRAIDAATVEIKRMFVVPGERGGPVARLLLAALHDEAAALGATRVVLETGSAQPDAIRFYERAGYRPIACFGAYAGAPLSRCYERMLADTR